MRKIRGDFQLSYSWWDVADLSQVKIYIIHFKFHIVLIFKMFDWPQFSCTDGIDSKFLRTSSANALQICSDLSVAHLIIFCWYCQVLNWLLTVISLNIGVVCSVLRSNWDPNFFQITSENIPTLYSSTHCS